MKRGEGKTEFFANLNYLKEQYKQGIIISKFLYEKAVEEKNFKMSYKNFNNYFNKYIREDIEIKVKKVSEEIQYKSKFIEDFKEVKKEKKEEKTAETESSVKDEESEKFFEERRALRRQRIEEINKVGLPKSDNFVYDTTKGKNLNIIEFPKKQEY